MDQKDMDPAEGDDAFAISFASMLEKMDRWTIVGGNAATAAYPAWSIYRHEGPAEPITYMQDPGICLIAQGHKRVLLGSDEYFYDQHHYLITSGDLPLVAQIVEASRQKLIWGLR